VRVSRAKPCQADKVEHGVGSPAPLQKAAVAAHATQAETLPELISRLDQLGSVETLRWLVSPARVPTQRVVRP